MKESSAEWLTAEAVAEMLFLSKDKLLRLTRAGQICGYRFGYKAKFVYKPEDIADYVKSRRGKA